MTSTTKMNKIKRHLDCGVSFSVPARTFCINYPQGGNGMNKKKCDISEWEAMLCEARTIARRSSNLTASAANSTALFALMVLERKLLDTLYDPTASLDDILLIADSIAALNDTITLYNIPLDTT